MAKRITSEEKERIKELRYQGYGHVAIAEMIGRSSSAVKKQFKSLGLPTNLKEEGIESKGYYPVLKIIQCKLCGKDYDTQRYNAKFCSDGCRLKYNKATILRKMTKCKGCGNEFESYRAKYCSSECRYNTVELSKRKSLTNSSSLIKISACECCGGSIFSRRKKRFCSKECNYKYSYSYVSQAKTHNIKCKECGKHKTVSFKRKSFCSTKCSKRYGYRAKETKRRRQILSNGDVNWDISIDRLINRDGSDCYICNEKVRRHEDINHDMYPSIEHVIPIAKGGTHTWDNVKLSHRKCNWEKGIEILEEELFVK